MPRTLYFTDAERQAARRASKARSYERRKSLRALQETLYPPTAGFVPILPEPQLTSPANSTYRELLYLVITLRSVVETGFSALCYILRTSFSDICKYLL